MEYFPRIHHIAALPQSPRVTVKIECNTRKIHRTDYLHVDVQRHLMGSQENERECELSAQIVSMCGSFLCMRNDFHQENGHSSDLDQKRSGILLMNTNHKEHGTESLN